MFKRILKAWWQAVRIAVSLTVTAIALFLYTNKVAEVNYNNGLKIGYTVGMQNCPKGATIEDVAWQIPES